MIQSRRIDPLLRRAQEHEDSVARDLAERQRTLAQHESRLEELRQYAEDYANSQMAATSPAQLANRRAFLERIDQALKQQLQNVDRSRASVSPSSGASAPASSSIPTATSSPTTTSSKAPTK